MGMKLEKSDEFIELEDYILGQLEEIEDISGYDRFSKFINNKDLFPLYCVEHEKEMTILLIYGQKDTKSIYVWIAEYNLWGNDLIFDRYFENNVFNFLDIYNVNIIDKLKIMSFFKDGG
jgi:hypothetical protein